MKNLTILLIISGLLFASACKKDDTSERFDLLTSHVWKSDSLLADGVDASGPGQILEKFKGDIEFKKDGTGYFGQYTGTWRFVYDETSLMIESPDLPMALTTLIVVLTEVDLKVTFTYPSATDPLDVRMTFKPK